MTPNQVKTATTAELVTCVDKAKNKAELNGIIYELACRTYVPFQGVNFDDLLISYGYQMDEKEKAARESKSPKIK